MKKSRTEDVKGQARLWEKTIPSGENSKCKGPEKRTCLACLRNSKWPVRLKQRDSWEEQ